MQEVAETEQTVLDMTREAAMAFLEADADGDAMLDYEEFRMAVPERMRGQTSEAALRELFNTADADGSGQISMSEFFLWTLTVAQSVGGKGLEAVFMRYDRDYRGTLDESEFAAACEEMGFGGLASELFSELDSDGSGTISYSELLGILKGRVNVVSKDCKRFLTTLAFDATKPRADASARSGGLLSDIAKGWALHGSDADALRLELREKLQAAKLKVSDLYRLMTRGQSRSLSAATFSSSMVEDLGFKGELSVLEGVYTDLDGDRSGVLGISELFAWINGKHSKAKLAKTVTLAYGRAEDARLAREAKDAAAVDAAHKAAGATATPAPAAEEVSADESVFSLASIEWSAVTLLLELQDMLLRAQLLPLDLIDAYEGYAYEGQLSFKQFLKMMKRLVNPISDEELDLWDIEVRPAVSASFQRIHGLANSRTHAASSAPSSAHNPAPTTAEIAPSRMGDVKMAEVQRWLMVGWTKRKEKRERERAAAKLVIYRAAHPDETAAADAAAEIQRLADEQVAVELAKRAAERRAYKLARQGAPPRSHRALDREVSRQVQLDKAERAAEMHANATSASGGAGHRGLPPVSTTNERILGTSAKLFLQLACRIAEEGGQAWLVKQRIDEARRRHEKSLADAQQAARQARAAGHAPFPVRRRK